MPNRYTRILATAALLLATRLAIPQAAPAVLYTNHKYNFTLTLPATWQGYTVHTLEDWHGTLASPPTGSSTPMPKWEKGPILTIRHPLWTRDHPREDIPIMVFTHPQWDLVQSEKLIVSAAPFPPSELGHNDKYVFALPPRYDFDELTGFEEVESIMKSDPLPAF